MRCEEIMKKSLECVSPGDTVQRAATRMKDRRIGFLPVCDDDQKVLGTLTDRDIALRVVAAGKPTDTPVQEVMTTDCVACRPSDDLATAQRLMAQHQKSRVMCTDKDGCLVGVISLSDIAQHDSTKSASETLRQITGREASSMQAEPGR